MAARKSRKPSIADASVTIKDIAEHLGISHSTVSRALSDHPYTNEQTKQNVRQAVERLGYVPNAAARSLRSDKGSLVGLILPQIQNELFGMAPRGSVVAPSTDWNTAGNSSNGSTN